MLKTAGFVSTNQPTGFPEQYSSKYSISVGYFKSQRLWISQNRKFERLLS